LISETDYIRMIYFDFRSFHRRQGLRYEHRIFEEVRHHSHPQHCRRKRGRTGRLVPGVLRRFGNFIFRISSLGYSDLQSHPVFRLRRRLHRGGDIEGRQVFGQLPDGGLAIGLLRHGLPDDQAGADSCRGHDHGQEKQRL